MSQYPELAIRALPFEVGRGATFTQPTVRQRLTLAVGGVGRRVAGFLAAGQLASVNGHTERARWTGARC